MPSPRCYDQFCPVAAALNSVGDRWALLVVRELMLGPRRFNELQRGLQGISTDILTARLRELEVAGVVDRAGEGRARSYRLTDGGYGLRTVLVELARWGSHQLEPPASADEVSVRLGLTCLLLDPPPLPKSLDGEYELCADDETARFAVRDGGVGLNSAEGAAVRATIMLSATAVRALMLGGGAADAASADVQVRGDARAARRLLGLLSGPRLLDGLRRRAAGAAFA